MRLALDSNLLLLLVVGITDRVRVRSHKRLNAYSVEAFDLLLEYARGAEEIVVTSHFLAETSNLIGEGQDDLSKSFRRTLAALLNARNEVHLPGVEITEDTAYLRLGIADSGALALLSDDLVLMTNDLDLYLEASKRDEKVVNFTHLQQARGLFD